jgi:hypothetical protein
MPNYMGKEFVIQPKRLKVVNGKAVMTPHPETGELHYTYDVGEHGEIDPVSKLGSVSKSERGYVPEASNYYPKAQIRDEVMDAADVSTKVNERLSHVGQIALLETSV